MTDNSAPEGSGADDPDLDPDMDVAAEVLVEARQRLAEAPADLVVSNHAMGLYELAAIHLTAAPPNLVEAALAIDALGCLVDGLGERLGENHSALRDALENIRMAFVQVKSSR
ncbi:MAG: hypothetical protein ACKOCE_11320 [Acidimicrobiia bacterium]